MPWVDREECAGCGICAAECPVKAIVMTDNIADIILDNCIYCGKCHSFCPEGAIRHDSERLNLDIKENIEKAKNNMEACGEILGKEKEKQKQKCLKRMIGHYRKLKTVAEKTLEELEKLRIEKI